MSSEHSVPTTSRNPITTLSTLSSHITWPTDTRLATWDNWDRWTTQPENSNNYMCMPKHRGFRLRRTLHVVFAINPIDCGLCDRAFWSNPHTNRISTLLTHVGNHEPHGSMRKRIFLSSDLLAHNPWHCTARHHGHPNSNHQKATQTGYLTLLSHKCNN